MRIKNKKTGEIADLSEGFIRDTNNGEMIQIKPVAISNENGYMYGSLAALNEEWEDCEEPKEYWYINTIGAVGLHTRTNGMTDSENLYIEDCQLKVGNHFDTREEAEQAVEKLRAFKRLKDKGFRFEPVDRYEALCGNGFNIPITATMPPEAYADAEVSKDLGILFGDNE